MSEQSQNPFKWRHFQVCCKKFKEDKMSMEWLCLFSLSCNSKQLGDQCDLA